MQWTVVVALLFALLVGVFAIQNAVTVPLKFFSYEFETSLVVVVLGGVALGALMIGILGLLNQIKNKIQIRNLKGKIKSLEKQIKSKEEKMDDLEMTLNALEVELARLEGAHEEILAQEALQVPRPTEAMDPVEEVEWAEQEQLEEPSDLEGGEAAPETEDLREESL